MLLVHISLTFYFYFLLFLRVRFCTIFLLLPEKKTGTWTIDAIWQDIGQRGARNAGHCSLDWTNTTTATIAIRLQAIAINCLRFAKKTL